MLHKKNSKGKSLTSNRCRKCADVDPPQPLNPGTMAVVTATIASNFSDVNDQWYVPSDWEDDERELILKFEMDYLVAKML